MAMERCFVEPRLAPIGNTFEDFELMHTLQRPEAFTRRHSFGDYVPHALAEYPTEDVKAGANVQVGKSKLVQRAMALHSLAQPLRRRRTIGHCPEDLELAADVLPPGWLSEQNGKFSSEQVCCQDSEVHEMHCSFTERNASLATESTEYVEGAEGLISNMSSLASWQEDDGGLKDLEAVSRQLAEHARNSYFQRLRKHSSARAAVGSTAAEPGARTTGPELPTLLTSRAGAPLVVKDSAVAAGGVQPRELRSGMAHLPVLLGAGLRRRAREEEEGKASKGVEEGELPVSLGASHRRAAWEEAAAPGEAGEGEPAASAATPAQPRPPASSAEEARSLATVAREAFLARQRRISQRLERCLAAFLA